jgi:hypothetical protein
MSRDASGTSWQPDATITRWGHVMQGDWTLAGHVMLNGIYDSQDGPRGDELVSCQAWSWARRAAIRGMAMP